MRKSLLVVLTVIFVTGCSSDPDSPIGAEFIEDEIFGSRPGDVFQDTLSIASGDTSYSVTSILDGNEKLYLGRRSGYEFAMVVKIDFSDAGSDTARLVQEAFLRLRVTDDSQVDVLNARFFELLSPYSEGDTLLSLDLSPSPIPDSSLTKVDREMRYAVSLYTLPPDLVQGWIRGQAPHNGVAVVLEDTSSGRWLVYGSRENGDSGLHPFLRVNFTDGTVRNYPASDDGTFIQPITTTTNLSVSDGFVSRIFIPLDLSQIPTDISIHGARLIIRVVPASEIGSDFGFLLYAPDSDDIDSQGIRTGQGVSTAYADFVTGELVFPVRNILQLFLSGERENNGFSLRFLGEGTDFRHLEFYPSSSGSLGPCVQITASDVPEFRK